MTVYNIPYNRQTDPNALFAQGAQNMVGGLLRGRQMRSLRDFAGSMDPEATAMQIVMDALSKDISPQIAMGLGSFQQRMQQSPHQRISAKKLGMIEKAEAEGDTEKVERLMGIRRKELEGMTREERIKALQIGLNAAGGQYWYEEGLGADYEGIAPQPKNPALYDFYGDLLRAEGIPVKERPGRVRNDGNLPGAGPQAGPQVGPGAGTKTKEQEIVEFQQRLEKEDHYKNKQGTGDFSNEEIFAIIEKAAKNGIHRVDLYAEGAKLKDLGLTKEELLTAWDKLAEGVTAEQIIEFLK